MQNTISQVVAHVGAQSATMKGKNHAEGEAGVNFESLLAHMHGTTEGETLEEMSIELSQLGLMALPMEAMPIQTEMPTSEEAIQTDMGIDSADAPMGDSQVLGSVTNRQPMLADLDEIRVSKPETDEMPQLIQQSMEGEKPQLETTALDMATGMTQQAGQGEINAEMVTTEATKNLIEHTVKVENSGSMEKALAERNKTEPFDGGVKETSREKGNPVKQLINREPVRTMPKAEIPSDTKQVEALAKGQTNADTQATEKTGDNPFKALENRIPTKTKVEGESTEKVTEPTEFQVAEGKAVDKVETSAIEKQPTKIANMQEVKEAIESAAVKGNEKVTVKLKPEVLGGLVIEAIKGQNGTKVSIIAETLEGLDALKAKLPEIENIIKQGGQSFEGLDLSYSNQQDGGQKWQQQMPRFARMAAPQAMPEDINTITMQANNYNAQGQLSLLA